MSIRKTWRVRTFAGALVGLLLGGVAIVFGAASRPVSAQGNELVVAVFGGTFEKAWRANVIQAFEKEHNANKAYETYAVRQNHPLAMKGGQSKIKNLIPFC